jgi:hypothetical protein
VRDTKKSDLDGFTSTSSTLCGVSRGALLARKPQRRAAPVLEATHARFGMHARTWRPRRCARRCRRRPGSWAPLLGEPRVVEGCPRAKKIVNIKGSRYAANRLKGEPEQRASNQGGGQVKRISIFGFGVLLVLAGTSAKGQDFTAGKTPAQLFSSDCAECHRTPNGLAKGRDVKTLAAFLREHYTTKSDTAGSLAAYVSGFAGSGPADVRNRAGAGAPPPASAERADRRKRDAEAAAPGDDAGPGARSPEDRARRRQRTVNLSGDGEKRRVTEGDAPRPPASATAPPPPAAPTRTAARTGESAPREAADPLSRLRPYLTSGLGYDGTVAEAAKTGNGKSRKRQGKEAGPPDAPPPAKADASPAAPSVPPGATAAAASAESTATMPAIAPPATPAAAPAAAPAPASAPTAVVAPPRLGQ